MRTLHWVGVLTISLALLVTACDLNSPTQPMAPDAGAAHSMVVGQSPGDYLGVFAEGGGLDHPYGMTFGPNGDLFVASYLSHQVLRYDGTTGAFVGVFASTAGGPLDLEFGPDGNLYVSRSTLPGEVARFDGSTGQFIDVFATVQNPYPNHNPGFLTFGPDGHLYVVTGANPGQVERFNGATGAFMGVFTNRTLYGPGGLTFGPGGDLYVTNYYIPDGVFRYDGSTGEYQGVFARGGGLREARGIAFGPDGHLYVSSSMTEEVVQYDGATGALIGAFASGAGLYGFMDIAFGADGNLYVGHARTDQIWLFAGPAPPTPEALINELIDKVHALATVGELTTGQANSLNAKLLNALDKLEQGNPQVAVNKLGDFIDQVAGLVNGGRLAAEDAAPLIELANQAIGLIEAE